MIKRLLMSMTKLTRLLTGFFCVVLLLDLASCGMGDGSGNGNGDGLPHSPSFVGPPSTRGPNNNNNNNNQNGPHHQVNPPPQDALPGFINLGNTCFANASLNAMLSSKELVDMLAAPLPKRGLELAALHQLRVNVQQSLKKLYDARAAKKVNLTTELNNYFDAFEKARKEIIAGGAVDGEKVGGKDKLRSDQGDARDFVEDNLYLLNYGIVNAPTFAYNVFVDDKSTKKFTTDDLLIGFTLDSFNDTKHSLADAYKKWTEPHLMDAPNQLEKTPGNFVTSNRFYSFRNPASPSLFLAALRFVYDLTGKPAKKLSTPIEPSLTLEIATRDSTTLAKKSHTYRLKSIVIHRGSLGGGHYYAYVYNQDKKRWEKYDDSSVSIVDEAAVLSDASNSYIFVYDL